MRKNIKIIALMMLLSIFNISSAFAKTENFTDNKVILKSTKKSDLNAYITKPKGPKKYPALLIVLGSGKGSTDDPTRAYNPFRDIAQRLANQDIVTLRFDKRGSGYNSEKGKFEIQSFNDYIADVEDALTFLKKDPSVNPNQIIIMGHSIGTLVAAELAAKYGLAGLILSAGPSMPMLKIMEEQQQFMNDILFSGNAAKAKQQTDDSLNTVRQISAGVFKFEDCKVSRCKTIDKVQVVDDQALDFWKEILVYDIRNSISKFKPQTNVLCLGGGSDWVVEAYHADENCKLAVKNKLNAHSVIIPDMDHFLALSKSKKENLEALLKHDVKSFEFNEKYFGEISTWIGQILTRAK